MHVEESAQVVLLPDGNILSLADLPESVDATWPRHHKRQIARAVLYGLIAEEDVCARYALDAGDLRRWIEAAQCAEPRRLKVSFQ